MSTYTVSTENNHGVNKEEEKSKSAEQPLEGEWSRWAKLVQIQKKKYHYLIMLYSDQRIIQTTVLCLLCLYECINISHELI